MPFFRANPYSALVNPLLTPRIALPDGTPILSSNRRGSSEWTVTARLEILLADGVVKKFFLKITTEESGRIMMEGEYNSTKSLDEISPDFVHKPHTWGKFRGRTSFYATPLT
ncbi:uncharacterized protein ALTATR162_LOCUS4671 [Alternaria atra]|uniref:Uncharacterized protein n=1 Tax=Alternaria atra TaxID=119953 RepID=A0A8J2MZC9_9PLEO|nr:uncharacterized protein ALTATR162_LOCUS4671 [Alternaria atra]CAG5156878.1 unnamed protein product [Alternaria atra]